MAAQAAVGFIKQGCAMLHEGRMELEGAKKTVEGVLADVKAIKGIFDWFLGLFKFTKPADKFTKPEPAKTKPVAKAKAVAAQQSYEEMELKLIKDKGIANYFLVVREIVRAAKEKMLVGPGRGSAAGSLVCYMLGITDLDPKIGRAHV